MTVWIRDAPSLEALARSLAGCHSLALDTESDSLYHHFEKVCLVQLATERGEHYLIDALQLRDLSPLAPAMADPTLTKILHGADYDVCSLKRDFGFSFSSLFDTMIAARLLGRTALSLLALVRDELGVTLSKDSQKDDWSRRPLTPRQEAYAVADVAHLIALHRRLSARLESLGRLAWLREECEVVTALEPAAKRRDPNTYLSIRGAKRLQGRALAALRELHRWRERRAEQIDVPAFKVVGNEALLRLAELPADAKAIPAGLPPRLRRHERELLGAIARAHALPEADLPVLPRVSRPVPASDVLRRIERLKRWRTERADELKLDVAVVLPQRLIDKLAEAAPRDTGALAAIEGLRRWRIESFGRDLLAAI